jgi:hypothetical protein
VVGSFVTFCSESVLASLQRSNPQPIYFRRSGYRQSNVLRTG